MPDDFGSMTIGEIVCRFGIKAGEIIDSALCKDDKVCCPGTTLQLGYAARITGNSHKLAELIAELKKLEK